MSQLHAHESLLRLIDQVSFRIAFLDAEIERFGDGEGTDEYVNELKQRRALLGKIDLTELIGDTLLKVKVLHMIVNSEFPLRILQEQVDAVFVK